jgi:hypothetical protein
LSPRCPEVEGKCASDSMVGAMFVFVKIKEKRHCFDEKLIADFNEIHGFFVLVSRRS